MTETLTVRADRDTVTARMYGLASTDRGVLLAHGAGAGQNHEWITTVAAHLASHDLTVMTFDYAYSAAGRKAPDRMPRLLDVHQAALEAFTERVERVVLAGKSMGSRVGAHLIDERGAAVDGTVAYGYPIVALGKKEPRPFDHLERIDKPQLFFAGTRDRLSPPDIMRDVVARLPDATLTVIEDADHSFRVPKRAGTTTEAVLAELAAATAAWIEAIER